MVTIFTVVIKWIVPRKSGARGECGMRFSHNLKKCFCNDDNQ